MTGAVQEPAGLGPAGSFGFNLAKVPDHGEDSDPILRDGPDLGLAAVFDGMGGAGGTVYETPDGPRSGAWIASRVVREVVEQHLLDALVPDRPLDGEAVATVLHDAIESALQARLIELDAPVSRLKSRLLRALPTTMALAALQRGQQDGAEWACHVLWAGDSRVYALDASGLHQLSVDDLREPGDAMANLRHDSVISNAISADTAFRINHRRVALRAPFVLLCATDGCFGYLRSPMHFEQLLLRTLAASSTDEQWSAQLQEQIGLITGDDASMAAIAVGGDVPGFRALLAGRLSGITEQYTVPLDDLADQVVQADRALAALQLRRAADADERWRRYRDGYEQLLRQDPEPQAEPAPEAPARHIWNPLKPIGVGGGGTAEQPSASSAAPDDADGEGS